MKNLTDFRIKKRVRASGYYDFEILYRCIGFHDEIYWASFDRRKVFHSLDAALAEACFLQDDIIRKVTFV